MASGKTAQEHVKKDSSFYAHLAADIDMDLGLNNTTGERHILLYFAINNKSLYNIERERQKLVAIGYPCTKDQASTIRERYTGYASTIKTLNELLCGHGLDSKFIIGLSKNDNPRISLTANKNDKAQCHKFAVFCKALAAGDICLMDTNIGIDQHDIYTLHLRHPIPYTTLRTLERVFRSLLQENNDLNKDVIGPVAQPAVPRARASGETSVSVLLNEAARQSAHTQTVCSFGDKKAKTTPCAAPLHGANATPSAGVASNVVSLPEDIKATHLNVPPTTAPATPFPARGIGQRPKTPPRGTHTEEAAATHAAGGMGRGRSGGDDGKPKPTAAPQG